MLTHSSDINNVLKSLSDNLKDPEAFLSKQHFNQSVRQSYEVLELNDQRYFEWYALPQRLGPDTIGYVWSFRDITERKNMEEALKRSNEFAYIASHDLQEPLRTISNFSKLLENEYKGQIGEEADEYIHFITTATVRMQGLIKDLLDFSRIGRNRTLETVDCNEVLKEVLMDVEGSI